MNLLHEFGLAFMAFFAIMNPISSLPVYISLTSSDDTETARAIARKGLVLAFMIVAVFTIGGQYIFSMFGITLPALRLAGGSLVFLIGFHMVQGKQSPTQKHPATSDNEADKVNAGVSTAGDASTKERNKPHVINQDKLNIAISPLATPLLAGPGTIATAMSLSAHHSISDSVITLLAFGLLCLITYVLFLYGKTIVKLIGDNAMNVMTRMMGLILAVIGAQMLIQGMQGAFKVLAA